MRKITTVHQGKGRRKRVELYLDGKLNLSTDAQVTSGADIQSGQVLPETRIETLVNPDSYERCLTAAMRYLAYRPRSNAELLERLQRRGFDNKTQEMVINKLKEQGWLDDTKFAEYWKDNRESFSPRSRRLTRVELQRKGVARDIIDRTIGEINDESNAYRAAVAAAARLPRSDRDRFFHRLEGYLRRRGFGYDIIEPTLEKVWREQELSDN
jgi:regulatory protein